VQSLDHSGNDVFAGDEDAVWSSIGSLL